jgi:hypothetical protein
MPIRIIERSRRISEATKKPWHAPSKPEFLISKDSLRIFKEDLPALKKRLKAESNKEDKEVVAKKSAKDNFDDVKLMMYVHWNGSYSNSKYKFFIESDKLPEQELELGDRFRPVLYRLVRGAKKAKTPNDYVENKELKKAFSPRDDIDDAKKEIVKSFKVIGSRASKIINIERGKGKMLMIPKKNIKVNETGTSPFKSS